MFQYRLDIILWMISELSTPLVSMAVWYAVTKESNSAHMIITYYVAVMFISILTNSWNGFFFAFDILQGEISKDLTKPLGAFWKHIANNVVEKSLKFLIPLPLIIGLMIFFPRLFPPLHSLSQAALFIVSLILAAIISFTLDMSFGALAFWLEDAAQLRQYKELLQEIASGILIPFSLLPPLAFTLLSFLPFRYMVSVPAEIIIGQANYSQALTLIGYQIIWTIGLSLGLYFLWIRGLKRYAAPGN